MRDNPTRPPQLDKLLNIRISVAQHRALHDAARRHDLTAAQLIRHGIAAQISRLDKIAAQISQLDKQTEGNAAA